MKSEQQRRKALEKMAQLFETESHYHPYADTELAEKLGITEAAAGYYRREYFQMGNVITRRAQYMRQKKLDGTLPLIGLEEDECRPKAKGKSPNRKANAKAKRKTAKKGS